MICCRGTGAGSGQAGRLQNDKRDGLCEKGMATGPVHEDRQHHRCFAISLNSSMDCRRSRVGNPAIEASAFLRCASVGLGADVSACWAPVWMTGLTPAASITLTGAIELRRVRSRACV